MNKILLQICFLVFCPGLIFIYNNTSAQVTVTGTVTNKDGETINSAIIICKKSDQGVYSDDKGEYRIIVNPPDTIIVSAMGYAIKKIPVRNKDSVLQKINIILSPKAYELNSVNILAPRNYEEVKDEIKGLKPFEYKVQGLGAAISPITFLYERFSRRAQSEKKVAELENEDLKRDALKDLLAQYVSRDILQLDAAEFDDFLAYCRLSDEFILNSSQYDLIMELKRSYVLYMKMKYR